MTWKVKYIKNGRGCTLKLQRNKFFMNTLHAKPGTVCSKFDWKLILCIFVCNNSLFEKVRSGFELKNETLNLESKSVKILFFIFLGLQSFFRTFQTFCNNILFFILFNRPCKKTDFRFCICPRFHSNKFGHPVHSELN